MFTLTLDDETAKKLQEFARQQNRSPNDVVRDLLDKMDESQSIKDKSSWLKRIAERAEHHTEIIWKEETDLSERSREILNDEFADYLINRMERSDDERNSP